MRAVPPGSARYWSWLFAGSQQRAPLLGIYALLAEWQALADPSTESSVAQLKFAWWQDEMRRMQSRTAVHPISVYIAEQPGAAGADFGALLTAVQAAADQAGGVPLERASELEAQARALWGAPLALASRLASSTTDEHSLQACTTALAAGGYLALAIRDYSRNTRLGRIYFAIDELLAWEIDNADLSATEPPANVARYLEDLRGRAMRYFDSATQAIPAAQRSDQRHLLVLAALGAEELTSRRAPRNSLRIRDLLLAWSTARHA